MIGAPVNDNEPKGPICPICGKPRAKTYRPFCSKHCADVDLGRWMKGSYAIPGPAFGDDDEADRPAVAPVDVRVEENE